MTTQEGNSIYSSKELLQQKALAEKILKTNKNLSADQRKQLLEIIKRADRRTAGALGKTIVSQDSEPQISRKKDKKIKKARTLIPLLVVVALIHGASRFVIYQYKRVSNNGTIESFFSNAESQNIEKDNKGSRSNPYHFGEEIKFDVMNNGELITYCVEFSEIIKGKAARNVLENPSLITENDFAVRAKASLSGDHDSLLDMAMVPVFLDENFNASVANFAVTPVQTAGGRNNSIGVYCGGKYDIVYTPNVKIEKDFPYIELQINGLYIDGESQYRGSIWIETPSNAELENGQFYSTGRGFDTEPIVGSWSSTNESRDSFIIFYKDNTFDIYFGNSPVYSTAQGTWERDTNEREIDVEGIIDPNIYTARFNGDSDVMVCAVYDDPDFGDGEKDSLELILYADSMLNYVRD